jgi:hypothetical protein
MPTDRDIQCFDNDCLSIDNDSECIGKDYIFIDNDNESSLKQQSQTVTGVYVLIKIIGDDEDAGNANLHG